MRLDTYRTCTRAEKRDVLEAFWRQDRSASPRIRAAAIEYGPWAVLLCAVLALEPLPVLVLSAGHAPLILAIAVATEVLLVLALWRSTTRLAALRRAVA